MSGRRGLSWCRLAAGLFLALAGCAVPFQGGPSADEFAHADFGPPPVNYASAIHEHLGRTLFDPFSAHIEIGQPEHAWYGTVGGLAVPRDIRFGWRVPVRVNARNRYGGYVGWRNYFFTFSGEQLVSTYEVP
jgi:hypothetical protein